MDGAWFVRIVGVVWTNILALFVRIEGVVWTGGRTTVWADMGYGLGSWMGVVIRASIRHVLNEYWACFE